MKTLEQVIMDTSAKHLGIGPTEAAAIAEAVRGWMREIAREPGHGPSGGVQDIQATRIKELEAEVARLTSLKSSPGCCDKAAKYDELRAKFPFLPGEDFWTLFQESVCKWTVEKVWFNSQGSLCLTGYRERPNDSPLGSPGYHANECHPTADACRAAIPVEE